MKPRSSNQANHALTLIEVLVVIAVLVLLLHFFWQLSQRPSVNLLDLGVIIT